MLPSAGLRAAEETSPAASLSLSSSFSYPPTVIRAWCSSSSHTRWHLHTTTAQLHTPMWTSILRHLRSELCEEAHITVWAATDQNHAGQKWKTVIWNDTLINWWLKSDDASLSPALIVVWRPLLVNLNNYSVCSKTSEVCFLDCFVKIYILLIKWKQMIDSLHFLPQFKSKLHFLWPKAQFKVLYSIFLHRQKKKALSKNIHLRPEVFSLNLNISHS